MPHYPMGQAFPVTSPCHENDRLLGRLPNRKLPIILAAIFALLFLSVQPAMAATDIVQFGQNVRIQEGQDVQDIVCFLCSVDAQGEVQGSIVVFGGNLRLRGNASQDVVVFAGNVDMGEESSIGGDLVIFGGKLKAPNQAAVHGDNVIFPAIIFLPIILFFAAVLALVIWLFRLIFFRHRPVYAPRV